LIVKKLFTTRLQAGAFKLAGQAGALLVIESSRSVPKWCGRCDRLRFPLGSERADDVESVMACWVAGGMGPRATAVLDLDAAEITFGGSTAVVRGQRVDGTTKGVRSRTISLDRDT
jgi:hypothetical protein